MPTTLHTHDLILRMKRIQQDNKLSAQNIYDMLENNGYHVSLNSIKKVFSEGSEHEHFRFHDTIQPISRVLLDIYGPETGDAEVDALKDAIRLKDELIAKREREIVELKTESQRKSSFLMDQIKLKDERIDKLMCRVDVLIQQINTLLEQSNK